MNKAILLSLLLILNPGVVMSESKSCTGPEHRQFDFWLGEWDVFDEAGELVGHNHIYPVLEGCALSENWTSVNGSPGKSYNFYDAAENKWHQTWIDQSGGALYLDGGLVDGSMVLSGPRPAEKGGSEIHRITWTQLKDGSVKQHWQSSSDGATQWQDVFVGYYRKKT